MPRVRAAQPKSRQPEVISSRENRWVQRFRAALAGRADHADGLAGIEGAHLVEEALRSSVAIEAILVSESGRPRLEDVGELPAAIKLLCVSDRIFASLAATETPQGIAALVRPRMAAFDELLRGPNSPLVVVLVGIQDPGNVGTILRTAEGLGASGVAACRAGVVGTAHFFLPKVIRSSAGSALRLPIVEGVAASVLMAQLRVSGVSLLAATSSRTAEDAPAVAPWQTDLRGPVALFIGNEGAGLPAEIERGADARIQIPLSMRRNRPDEPVESLNAAMAATILLYEAARQRAAVTDESSQTRHAKAQADRAI